MPPKLNVKRHEIDLAFAVTDYKVQGKTLDYIILSIGPRDGLMPHLSLTDVYTLASRVRLGSRLYVVGFDPKKGRHGGGEEEQGREGAGDWSMAY